MEDREGVREGGRTSNEGDETMCSSVVTQIFNKGGIR